MNNSLFSKRIIDWYLDNKRDLPWRRTRDPYKIWLSEVILQQTRVDQGLPYYLKFIKKYPEIRALAEAKSEQILKLWEGLGYYSRAQNLHKCAKNIVKIYAGSFPDSYNELLKLPGIGPYSAAAIASFAYQKPVAVLDGNVYRVLSRVFGIEDDIAQPKTAKVFQKLASELLDVDRPDLFNQAIMEYGAMLCKPKLPKCTHCVFTDKCYAYAHHAQYRLPVKSKKTKVSTRYLYYFIFEKQGKIAMRKRSEEGIWKGLYDFEAVESTTEVNIEDLLMKMKKEEGKLTIKAESRQYRHLLSHQRIYATFYRVGSSGGNKDKNRKYYTKDELQELAKPVLISKYLKENIF